MTTKQTKVITNQSELKVIIYCHLDDFHKTLIKWLYTQSKTYFEQTSKYYADLLNVKFNKIAIKNTKIHAVVDALGNPLKFTLTSGQRHDIIKVPELIKTISSAAVIADKGHDSQVFIDLIDANECMPVIPCKENRKVQRSYDEHLYKERQLIECFFGNMKNFRHVFSRFDKTALSFLSFLHFVSTFI